MVTARTKDFLAPKRNLIPVCLKDLDAPAISGMIADELRWIDACSHALTRYERETCGDPGDTSTGHKIPPLIFDKHLGAHR